MRRRYLANLNVLFQARRKHFGSGAAIGTKKNSWGSGAPGSSVNLGILKP